MDSSTDERYMGLALNLAGRGQGHVEPNPMVGCVVVHRSAVAGAHQSASADGVIGQGWHERFGGDHAEVNALRHAADRAQGATMYVTLEPCCHQGKTPPCTDAILRAGIGRVVVAQLDPNPLVQGRGVRQLRVAGITVDVGCCEQAARRLNAPYRMQVELGRPWVIAKWAMTLDGKIASRESHSRWISNHRSRAIVHGLRGRVDAIVVGANTARIDDPLLTARPSGPRVATRVVVDSKARLADDSRLVRTVDKAPVVVAVSNQAVDDDIARLKSAGCEVIQCGDGLTAVRLVDLLELLAQREMTNVLVEGGGRLLGSFWDAGLIDEVHAFVAPKLVGGNEAPGPIGGHGLPAICESPSLVDVKIDQVDGDLFIRGVVDRDLHPSRATENATGSSDANEPEEK